MNKLEEQIDKKSNDWVTDWMHENAFNAGAQFVIDLEIDIKFAMWCQYQTQFDLIGANELKYRAVRKFWIENIYGR